MRQVLCALAMVSALVCLPATSMAKQSFDFSDIAEPFITLPFNVINTEVTGEFSETHHIFHLSDSMDKVIKKLSDMYDKKQTLGKHYILGITVQLDKTYQVVIGYQNEHHYVTVKPEGSGCVFDLHAMPFSYVTGVYPIAIYGFTMPDGTVVSAEKFSDE